MSCNLRIVYAALRRRPSTCDEIERRTGLAHQVASARMRDLAKRSRIRPTGQTRKTRLGRPAKVWEAAQ